MTATVVVLETMLDFALEMILNSLRKKGAGHISAGMWNYLRSLGVDRHKTILQVVKE